MTVVFSAVVVFDGWLDGSMTYSAADNKAVQGTLLCILIVLLIIPAQLEFSSLAAAKGIKIFTPFSIIASILFATAWYWPQFVKIPLSVYLFFLCAFVLLGLFFSQYMRYGTLAVIANCGANYFSIIYLGLLSGFVVALRIDFGLWPMLMFVFVVKSADIGAYAVGKSLGRHKFSPTISPAKSWEGMLAAIIAAVIVAVLFAEFFDIMLWWQAAVFGLCFAFIGQMGDLAESMLKRDAERKDSDNKVPGFGGILDIIDSLLAAAPFAYLFFMVTTENYVAS